MALIIIGIIIIYLLVVIWTWTSLEDIEKKSKILIIFISKYIGVGGENEKKKTKS